MLTLLKRSLYRQSQCSNHGTTNGWSWEFKWLEHSSWIRRLGVRVPLRSRHFLSQKRWHFRKNIRSCVENECCCPRTVNSSNVNFTSNMSLNRVSIDSDNGLSPGRCQAIIWTNAGIFLIGPFGTKFNEILIEIWMFSFNKMYLKMSSGNLRLFVSVPMC